MGHSIIILLIFGTVTVVFMKEQKEQERAPERAITGLVYLLKGVSATTTQRALIGRWISDKQAVA